MTVAQKIYDITGGIQRDGHEKCPTEGQTDVAAKIMAKKKIAVETCKIVEKAVLVPVARAEAVGTDKLRDVGNEGGESPQKKYKQLLPTCGLRYPRIEDRKIEIQAEQHIDVPHVARHVTETVGNADDASDGSGKGLAGGFGPGEKEGYGIGTEPQQVKYPREQIITARPNQKRPKHPGNAAGIETAHGHRTSRKEGRAGTPKEQGSCEHDENRDAGTYHSSPYGTPTGELRVGLATAVRGSSIEGVAGMAGDEEEKGDKTQKVEAGVA